MPDTDHNTLFLDWFEKHGSAVVKVARAYTLNQEESKDLAQEILLQAWRSTAKFKGDASPATWFYRVALNTAMNWHRKDRPRRSHQKPLLEVVECKHADSARQVQQQDTIDHLYRAINRLSKIEAALVLLYLDEMSYREMSQVLGISENNVGVKLNRAKKKLSELMREGSDAA